MNKDTLKDLLKQNLALTMSVENDGWILVNVIFDGETVCSQLLNIDEVIEVNEASHCYD